MLGPGAILWGVKDLEKAASFWCAALGFRVLKNAGGEVVLVPEAESGAVLTLRNAHNGLGRQEIYLYADDQEEEVARLVDLGASLVSWDYQEEDEYVYLADPDGNPFFVFERPTG